MFVLLLMNLRAQGVKVGMGEWLRFLEGVQKGLVTDLDSLYRFGRAVLCHSEAHYDAFDLAFQAAFEGVELPGDLKEALEDWLKDAREATGERVHVDMTPEELLEEFRKRLAEQKERHDGGNKWVGTGGSSPYGRQGKADKGVRVGPEGDAGGGRSAIRVAGERRWRDYRTDTALEVRDFKVALRALRNLVKEGQYTLDLDGTIDATAHNAGDIDLVYERERKNRTHLVLLMDTGGSMDPHARLVERLFTASKELKGFKSFQSLFFHNAPYGHLYKSFAEWERVPIPELIKDWTPKHRIIWVGDASMAPYELLSDGYWGYSGRRGPGMSGLDWISQITRQCPNSVWLNPDAERWWNHPTVRAIGNVVPMFPLSVGGVREAVKKLRSGV